MGDRPTPIGKGKFVTCIIVVSNWWLVVSKVVGWDRYNRCYAWEFQVCACGGPTVPFLVWCPAEPRVHLGKGCVEK